MNDLQSVKIKIELNLRAKLFMAKMNFGRLEKSLSCWPPWIEYNLTVTFMIIFVVLSLQSPCSAVVCGTNRKCVASYKENSYACLCKEGFTGRNCETGKIASYGSDPKPIKSE